MYMFLVSCTARSSLLLSWIKHVDDSFFIFSLCTSLISSTLISVVYLPLTQHFPASSSYLYYVLFSRSVFSHLAQTRRIEWSILGSSGGKVSSSQVSFTKRNSCQKNFLSYSAVFSVFFCGNGTQFLRPYIPEPFVVLVRVRAVPEMGSRL